MPKLTKRFVDTLRPAPTGKDIFVWDSGDGAIKGFGIRIKPSGTASYLVQYRNKEQRTRRLVLGKVSVLTPDEARGMAQEKLKEATKGSDPSAERKAIRKAISVSELCDLYLIEAKGQIKDSTLEMDHSRIKCHVNPLLGRMSVRSLTLEDIERFQADIAAGKTAKPRPEKGRTGVIKGGRGTARRTLEMFATILEFAKRRKIITENPAKGVRKFEGKKVQRFLSLEEIAALGKAMHESETENPTGIAAIKALLVTGCRKTEILSLPWVWLDIRASCIRFGDTKSGAQLRPIGVAAVKHFAAQKKRTITSEKGEQKDSPWIFPAGRGEGHFIGLPKVLARLCKKAELDDVTVHILRHTFAAVAAELGFSELTIAGLLGHTVPGITARYAHIPDSALVSAADRVSEHIWSLLHKGQANSQTIKIHSLR